MDVKSFVRARQVSTDSCVARRRWGCSSKSNLRLCLSVGGESGMGVSYLLEDLVLDGWAFSGGVSGMLISSCCVTVQDFLTTSDVSVVLSGALNAV
jgi:hypothetical protein